MWALPYVSPPGQLRLLHPNSVTPRAVSANSQPPQNDVGALGRTILTALQSNPKPTSTSTTPNPRPKREGGKEEDGKQISGSDVLWAMQKAADKKNKLSGKSKKKKKMTMTMAMAMAMSREGLSSASGHREEELAGDYSKVRPLLIKTEWGPKLDELEKSLHQLYETK